MTRGRDPGRGSRPGPSAGTWPIDTGTVRLVPDGPDWIVEVNGVPSSCVCPGQPDRLAFGYLRQLAAALAVLPGERVRVLHVGGAGCALAWALAVTRPGTRQVVVEVDAELARLVRTWFDLPGAPGLRLRVGEGRAVVTGLGSRSRDAVVRDAFAGDRTPPALATLEFTREVARVLRPDGWYLANLADPDPVRLRSEIATAGAVFDEMLVVTGPSSRRRGVGGNLVLVAGARLPVAELTAALRAVEPSARMLTGAGLSRLVAGAPVLRDEIVGGTG